MVVAVFTVKILKEGRKGEMGVEGGRERRKEGNWEVEQVGRMGKWGGRKTVGTSGGKCTLVKG